MLSNCSQLYHNIIFNSNKTNPNSTCSQCTQLYFNINHTFISGVEEEAQDCPGVEAATLIETSKPEQLGESTVRFYNSSAESHTVHTPRKSHVRNFKYLLSIFFFFWHDSNGRNGSLLWHCFRPKLYNYLFPFFS